MLANSLYFAALAEAGIFAKRVPFAAITVSGTERA